MFQFGGSPIRLCIQRMMTEVCSAGLLHSKSVNHRSFVLPTVYRSLSRPSSALGAKASALCSYQLDLCKTALLFSFYVFITQFARPSH